MMTITDLARSFGSQILFEQVSLQLDPGNRYGLVGANGSGKSTLLRILSGQESSSAGTVATPRNARLGVLAQDHFLLEDIPIQDVVMMGDDEVWRALKEQEALLAQEPFDESRFGALEEVITRFNGYSLGSRASAILEGLGIATKLHRQPLSTLSGGFKLRVLLGQVLAGRPDILLLDEPTNHLDIVSVAWMERFLLDYAGCAIVVSHDQQFLDNVCTHILDLDYARVTPYKGNYTAFAAAKIAYRDRKEAEIARRKAEIAERQAWIARFKATATKARQAASRQKQVERIVVDELPASSRRYPTFRISQRRPSGREVLTVKDLWKAYGPQVVLSDVSFTVHRGEKIAVLGPNGAGKSTLLRALVGALTPDAGTVTWGYEAYPGYFPQDHREILNTGEQTLLAWLWDVVPVQGVGYVRGKLAEVLFGQDDVDKRVAVVSGGEAARLILARLGLEQPNVLILDEPTNHLDLEAIEALEAAIQRYDGTLILVSHNRWLVSRVATRVIEVSPAGVRDFPGTYAEYLAKEGADHLDRVAVVEAAREERRAAKASKAAPPAPTPEKAKAPEKATPKAEPKHLKKPEAKSGKSNPAPKAKDKKKPLWFEEQAGDKPEAGSWAEFFAHMPGRGQPSKR